MICLAIMLSADMGDRELKKRASFRQIQCKEYNRELRTSVIAGYLSHHYLRIGLDVERCCFQYQGALESLDHRQVFGDIIVLMSDPLGDLDFAYWTALNYHANTSGTWIPQGSTIHICHQR